MIDHGERYERAFEAHLRALRLTCIPIEESRRTFLDNQSLKSLDFIVRTPSGRFLLIDVKGRRLVARRNTLESWATRDDIESMGRWQSRFGENARSLLVFVYHLSDNSATIHFDESFVHAERVYGCLAVSLDDYRMHMRRRSPKWDTVNLSAASFRQVARPFTFWLQGSLHDSLA